MLSWCWGFDNSSDPCPLFLSPPTIREFEWTVDTGQSWNSNRPLIIDCVVLCILNWFGSSRTLCIGERAQRLLPDVLFLGEPSLKKNWKIWEKFEIRLAPPPRIIQNFLNFRTFWKLPTPPPPLGSNSELFEFQTFLIKVKLQTTLSNNWNSDIFEKLRPPPRFFKFPNWNWEFSSVFLTPPLGIFPKFSRFF